MGLQRVGHDWTTELNWGIFYETSNFGRGDAFDKTQRWHFLWYFQCFCALFNEICSICVDHNKLWKILQEIGIPDHLTCLLRNLYAGQEATVRTGHGTTDWFQIGKGVVHQGCILSPSYLTSIQSTSWGTLVWKKHKLESRLLGEISITSDMQMTPPLWQKVKRNSEAFWWK